MRAALTIAGLDPSGGAGLAADLRTFDRYGVHGAVVATMWTVQGSRGVSAVWALEPDEVGAQLDEVLGDLDVAAAKTGALGSAGVVEAVAARFSGPTRVPLVVDPVLLPTEGLRLGDDDCAAALVRCLLPVAVLVTPNLDELAQLTGRAVGTDQEIEDACRALADRGAAAVLAKGGHGTGPDAVDLFYDGTGFERLRAPRRLVEAGRLHGAGCTLSAAIAAGLATGLALRDALTTAKEHVAAAIAQAWPLGAGDLWALGDSPVPAGRFR